MSVIVTTRPPSLVVIVRWSRTPELMNFGQVANVWTCSFGPLQMTQGSSEVEVSRPVVGSQVTFPVRPVGNPGRFWLAGCPLAAANRACAEAGS